ncbi:hypothetical protein BDP27DRAFT_354392 [Rhodocollybia butyracea]|uniref:Uncharacterized protein n=1 Tax=Rhodocollybia butyracea TaxID=206335 RepID=A0A9P5UAI1_9AGAR|nr:hypothetical protein BDP27DRAFT_354392 [Rhodocollybia butyracea]
MLYHRRLKLLATPVHVLRRQDHVWVDGNLEWVEPKIPTQSLFRQISDTETLLPSPSSSVNLGPASQVASCSVAGGPKYHNDDRLLREYTPDTPLPILLSKQWKNFVWRTRQGTLQVDSAVRACLTNQNGREALFNADVIATRSAMDALMRGHGALHASLIKNRLYLQEYPDLPFTPQTAKAFRSTQDPEYRLQILRVRLYRRMYQTLS